MVSVSYRRRERWREMIEGGREGDSKEREGGSEIIEGGSSDLVREGGRE
jgi:hypothetical protein